MNRGCPYHFLDESAIFYSFIYGRNGEKIFSVSAILFSQQYVKRVVECEKEVVECAICTLKGEIWTPCEWRWRLDLENFEVEPVA